jgi:hypothetical protein
MDANEHIKPNDGPTYTRWYDRQQTVSKSVKLLESFPVDYQEVLGDTIIKLAGKHCDAEALMADLRALGPEKVLNIFKAKSKNRGYDQNETVHKAMNYMYVLPDENRVFIATQVIEVVGHLFEYFSICRETGQAPAREVVQSLSNAFVRGQLNDTVEHLTQFYPSMNLPNGPTLKSIRSQISKARTQAYEEEIAQYKSKQVIGAMKRPTSIVPEKPQKPQMSIQPEIKSAEPPPVTDITESVETAPQLAQPAADPSEKVKDETLAQDNRGMKIRLDKFEL